MKEKWEESDWYKEWLEYAHKNLHLQPEIPKFNYNEIETRLQSQFREEQQKKLDK